MVREAETGDAAGGVESGDGGEDGRGRDGGGKGRVEVESVDLVEVAGVRRWSGRI